MCSMAALLRSKASLSILTSTLMPFSSFCVVSGPLDLPTFLLHPTGLIAAVWRPVFFEGLRPANEGEERTNHHDGYGHSQQPGEYLPVLPETRARLLTRRKSTG
jgi:hypothetical protein